MRRTTAMARWTVPAMFLVTAGCGSVPPGYGPPPALPPGVVDHREERGYEVDGSTREELIRELRTKGPRADGRNVWGRHEWRMRWRFQYAPDGPFCRMTGVRVDLESVTTLPRWRTRHRADPDLVRSWDAMIEALRVHENGHRDIAYRAARDVDRTLRRISEPDCSFISSRANRAAQDILERYREINRRYDADTRSGAAQGVTLRPPGGAAP
jgi:predicted secreted Zn-dependent protease